MPKYTSISKKNNKHCDNNYKKNEIFKNSKLETDIILTKETMSEKSSLSKWFWTSNAAYSKPCLCLPSFSDKNSDIVW